MSKYQAWRCDDCGWTGRDAIMHGADPECPDCSNYLLTSVALCLDCADNGVDERATCDDYCRPCAEKNFEPWQMESFRRDQVQPVRDLTRKTA